MVYRDYSVINPFEEHVEKLLEGMTLSLDDKIKIHKLCDRRLLIKSDIELDEYAKDIFVEEIEDEINAIIDRILKSH